jgi:hypothetical protein
MTKYKQLCADLVAWAEKTSAHYYSEPGVLIRARAELTEPEPEPPTDEEIMALMPQQMHEDLAAAARALAEQAGTDSTRAKGVMRIILNRHVVDHARAILARWGNHPANPDTSPQPIPVSERMPMDEDCNKEGMCWWWHPGHPESGYSEGWMQRPRQWGYVRFRYVSDDALVCTHWLPAHALPLPTTHD